MVSVKLYPQYTHPTLFAAGDGGVKVDFGVVNASAKPQRPPARGWEARRHVGDPPASGTLPSDRDHTVWVTDAMSEGPVVVKLRGQNWNDVAGTPGLLNRLGAAWTRIDEPRSCCPSSRTPPRHQHRSL